MKPIYLDNNASTPLEPGVIDKMKQVLEENFGNPSSHHFYGIESKKLVQEARRKVAAMLHADSEEIIFTSGGSESNNMAIKGLLTDPSKAVLTTTIEHPSVSNVCEQLPNEVIKISVDDKCRIKMDDLTQKLSRRIGLITIMLANNETGTIQNIKSVVQQAKKFKIPVHTDAAQAAGKIPIDVEDLGVDLLTIAGHKMNGPKGIGALYVRKGTEIKPLIDGADHEKGLRAGTENVLEIAGLGEAAKIFAENTIEILTRQQQYRDRFFEALRNDIPNIEINGDLDKRLPNTVNIYFPKIDSSQLLAALPEIAASAGAACHADAITPSAVLKAMGLSDKRAQSSVRFSVGRFTTNGEIDFAVKKIVTVVNQLRKKTQHSRDPEKLKLSNNLGCSCKVSPEKLSALLEKVSNRGFEDASIQPLGNGQLLLTSVDFFSPMVTDPFDFGRIAAANALSDIYAMGGRPISADNILVFPAKEKNNKAIQSILRGAAQTAKVAGIEITGGHSLSGDDLIFGLSVNGLADSGTLLRNSGAKAGDWILLTKPLGSGILCEAAKKSLINRKTFDTLIDTMVELNKNAAEIIINYQVTACTDITGFGFLGHLTELLRASNKAAVIDHEQIPVLENCRKMVDLGIFPNSFYANRNYYEKWVKWNRKIYDYEKKILHDPQTSGGLLFTVNETDKTVLLREFNRQNLRVSVVGRVIDRDKNLIQIQ